MSKQVTLGSTARENLVKGIDILADAVVSTLGPNGRNVVISNPQGVPQSTKDGVTVAKSITLPDPNQELGVQLVKQAAIKTAEKAGDGTTTSTLLAREMVKAGLNALNNNSNFKASEISHFDYEMLEQDLEKMLVLRKIDIKKYLVFGFVFSETSLDNKVELDNILMSDLSKYIRLENH